jgi:putative Mg2+ transporter-C (MgtC) family protein
MYLNYFSPQMTNELYFLAQIVLAIILGGVLGIQREQRGKFAGPRTYALVTAGATLFTILSISAFGADISRVASQIVIGIGFLGAGMILHKENRVDGLTTAAGIWMTAAVGMAVGVRYFILAIGVTLLILGVLMFDDHRFKNNKGDEDN